MILTAEIIGQKDLSYIKPAKTIEKPETFLLRNLMKAIRETKSANDLEQILETLPIIDINELNESTDQKLPGVLINDLLTRYIELLIEDGWNPAKFERFLKQTLDKLVGKIPQDEEISKSIEFLINQIKMYAFGPLANAALQTSKMNADKMSLSTYVVYVNLQLHLKGILRPTSKTQSQWREVDKLIQESGIDPSEVAPDSDIFQQIVRIITNKY